MSLLDRIRRTLSGPSAERLFGAPSAECLHFFLSKGRPDDEHWEVGSPLAVQALRELVGAAIAEEASSSFQIRWEDLYSIMQDESRSASVSALSIPPIGSLRPRLTSNNTLDDPDFEISIGGWINDLGRTTAMKLGAVARTDGGLQLLPKATFDLVSAIDDFWKDGVRGPSENRLHFGAIRSLAIRADAGLDPYLADTVVHAPERLHIKLKDVEVGGVGVIEVQPWFQGAPESWLDHFDRSPRVKDRYQIATQSGLEEVQVDPQVRSVLSAIKAMPGRRASGAAAERFLHNPFATLGPDASKVIDEEQFAEARREAGIDFERFIARPSIAAGELVNVGILAEKLGAQDNQGTYEAFSSPGELRAFIARVEKRIFIGAQLCEWRAHRFEMSPDTAAELEILKAAYIEWTKPKVSIRAVDVLDLSRYSQRVSGIGTQQKIFSPYIPVQSGSDPWFPEPPLSPESSVAVAVPISEERTLELLVDSKVFATLRKSLDDAELENKETIGIPGHPDSIPVATAQAIVDELTARFGGLDSSRKYTTTSSRSSARGGRERKELLLRANISVTEFAEERARELQFSPDADPRLPACLNRSTELREHQIKGVAWLQNLHGKAPDQCRGALLADDMGLGKTLQLLTLICRAFEEAPTLDPVLIVAPVSLLENWKEEADRFFGPARPKMLTLYGAALEGLRAPRSSIDSELLEGGIAKFLRDGWLGDSQVILTTYETLRDLEFSFASVRWSMMICDEAQKIKNPAAMVTRAAKKQNVAFRIACTGTPVENSLTDLWCLFDFIQPGLLGALNDFGATYRRPIECETDEQKSRIEQLRSLIAPQILRRTKVDVAKDLPPKIVVDAPRKLKISKHQRGLYGNALEQFKLRNEPGASSPFKNHLGLLHYLRRVCIAPEVGGGGTEVEPLPTYRRKNPKIDWLISTLIAVKAQSEKAIVFCEFKDIQALLAHYIEAEFGIRPEIVNGDTDAAATSAESRQKKIRRFQAEHGFGVIILSPIAVGFGVNIQAANHVVHFSRTWNPAKEDQATDRAYRIGQQRPVYVYYPVVCAEDFTTFDVKLDRLLERKRALSGDMLNGCGDLSPTDFAEIVDVDDRVFDEPVLLDHAVRLDPIEFEALVAVLWKKKGFRSVSLTSKTGDGGIDVIAKTVNEGELIQVKTSRSEGASLGWEAIKDVVAGEAKYRFENPGVTFTKVAVTNRSFNEAARLQARHNNVQLVDQNDIATLLTQHRVVRGDIELALAARSHVRL